MACATGATPKHHADRRFHRHHADQHHECQVMGEPGIYGRILIGRVLVGTRHRKLDPDKVKALADSMKAIGQQQPISVYYGEAGQVHLIAGSHRLEAAKLLRWEKIACVFVTLSEIDRQLWEIDENLCRAELSAREKREHVHLRKELWERQQAEKNNGAPCATNRGRGRPKGFAAETATAIGRSKSQINKLIAEPKATAAKTKRKTKRQDGKEVLQALLQERERQSQLMRQQWVAEGHSLEDPDKAVISYWENAWHDAHTREEREAWLADHPGDNPLPWYECQMTDAQREKYHRWREQRKPPSQGRILELKSQEHLSLLKAAWDAADKDARDKFRLYITNQEPEAA